MSDTDTEKRRPQIQFRPGLLVEEIDKRVSDGYNANEVARRDVTRYYKLLDDALANVELSEAEASLIVDAQNGVFTDEHSYRFLWAFIDDACKLDGLDEKWGVEGPSLVAKLRALGPAETMAITDRVEQFWRDPNAKPMGELLRELGLVTLER